MDDLPPICREQAFLETYCQCMSQFAFDKAKDSCDREKDNQKASSFSGHSSAWWQLLSILTQLAIAEKTYYSLLFLGQKWFVRKDNLRSTYGLLLQDLKKIEDASNQAQMVAMTTSQRGGASGQTPAENAESLVFEGLLAHLCGQIGQFMTARVKMMDFYESMAVMGTKRDMNYDDVLEVIMDITTAHQKSFHHPILAPIKYSFSVECEVIQHLLQAQLLMCHWQFLDSLLHLNEAHSKLASWATLLPSKEHKKLGFGKSAPIPPLYQWLVKYKATLVAKYSLYFYNVLSKQTGSTEMKALLAKTSIDFYSKIVSFQKKSDAISVSLVFDATGLDGVQKLAGYHHPYKVTESAKGLDSFPAIFCYPAERPDKHWPGIISIMTDRNVELTTVDKHVYFCDDRHMVTYFLSRIEPRITLAVIFESKKLEKDSYVNNFLVDITNQLRCSKLFGSLRPGAKV